MKWEYIALLVAGAVILMLLLRPGPLPPAPLPKIKVAGESLAQWSTSLKLQRNLLSALDIVRPRIMLNSAAASTTFTFASNALVAQALEVKPRITFAYAAGSSSLGLKGFHNLGMVAAGTGPRIVIDQAATTAMWDLLSSKDLAEQTVSTKPRIMVEGARESTLNQNLQGSDALVETASSAPRVTTNGAGVSDLERTGPKPSLPKEK